MPSAQGEGSSRISTVFACVSGSGRVDPEYQTQIIVNHSGAIFTA